MLGSILTYVISNTSLGSYVTGWILTNDFVKVGNYCTLNPKTRIRFSSKYCAELDLVEILNNTGVNTLPELVHALVLLSFLSSVFSLFIKIKFQTKKEFIVFFDSVCFTSSLGAMLLYFNLIDTQLIFTEDNSIIRHTGFHLIISSFAFSFVVLLMSLVKLKRADDTKWLWLN